MVTDWAVEWVVDEQILHDSFLVCDGFRRLGVDFHAIGGHGLAGWDELWDEFDFVVVARIGLSYFCEADTAASDDGHRRMVAVMRNLDAVLQSDLDDGFFAFKLAFFAINLQRGHFCIFRN